MTHRSLRVHPAAFASTILVGLAVGCSSDPASAVRTPDLATAADPADMHPFQQGDDFIAPRSGRDPATLPPPIRFAEGRTTAVGTTEAILVDSRRFDPQIAARPPFRGPLIRPASVLPKHHRDKTIPRTAANDLVAGGVTDRARATPMTAFPGIVQTPWRPPDPSIAVGTDHVVQTVNMEIAWYGKDGTPQFQQRLDASGEPGFLEEVGAGGFTFDPKCFHDPYIDRYVMVALEVYRDDREAWITIAVSDDGDPNGLWYKYRTWALIASGERDYWVDFPGFGYDERGWYVTGNLFALEGGDGPGFLGSIVRSIDKTGPLAGEPVGWTDRVVGGASYQVSHAPESGDDVRFVRASGNTQLTLGRLDDPFGAGPWETEPVAVPAFGSANRARTPIGPGLWVVDPRIWQAYRRGDRLAASHAITSGGSEDIAARWYEIDLAGTPELVMSGELRFEPGEDTIFPAVAIDVKGAIGTVYGRTSETAHPSVGIAGRIPGDPEGTMAIGRSVVEGETSPADGDDLQRWGDYFDCVIDPVDGRTFWAVGEIQTPEGWSTEIVSFRIGVAADLNRDGRVDGADLGILLKQFGGPGSADLNGDGLVDGVDLGLFLVDW